MEEQLVADVAFVRRTVEYLGRALAGMGIARRTPLTMACPWQHHVSQTSNDAEGHHIKIAIGMNIKERIEGFRGYLGFAFLAVGYRLRRVYGRYPILKAVDPAYVEVLGDPDFQASVREVAELSLLDTERLANLWTLCKMTDPGGNILEIGCYRGGTALHLSNAQPQRKIIACDSFRSFETVDPVLDRIFNQSMFRDATQEGVMNLFRARHRPYDVLAGFFPASCAGKTIGPLSFVHLDVDVYKASSESLAFLAQEGLLMQRSLMVVDGYNRHEDGTNKAISEFVRDNPRWAAFPIFPSQCLLIPSTWFKQPQLQV